MGWCWHNWPKWSEPQEVNVSSFFPLSGKEFKGVEIHQHRVCRKCGLHHRREIKTP